MTRTAVDLADPRARDAFFTEALDGATKALVLTEGLLMYLEDRDDAALSESIKRPEVFAPDNGLAYFEDLGWQVLEAESLLVAANRFRRLPIFMRPVAWLPQPNPRHRVWSAAALLTH